MKQTCSPGGLAMRWCVRLLTLLLGTLLASLAYEPFGQAWLAWCALVPLLLVLQNTRSVRAAFAWGWFAGVLFFATNIWWLWTATLPGTVALILYFALYWGLAAVAIRGLGLTDPDSFHWWAHPPVRSMGNSSGPRAQPATGHRWELLPAVALIAAVWVACEWLRSYAIRGFPWMLLGHSQTPLPVMCQGADAAGVFGISFWVVLVNALILFAIIRRQDWRSLLPAAAFVGIVVLVIAGYGAFRLSEDATYSGPRVMVVQPNHPHLPGGARTVSREDAIDFHLATTREALRSSSPHLIVWSETVMPPLNAEAREELRSSRGGQTMERTHRQIGELTRAAGTSLVTGANHVGAWRQEGRARVGTEIRNSVYFYGPEGHQSAHRYDKTQLVPFAETVAFRESVPWLHRVLMWLAPPVAAQPLVAGGRRANPVFTVQASLNTAETAPADHEGQAHRPPAEYRFITPICLENIDPGLIAGMFRDPEGHGKRADFLVNVSNDGWFHPMERAQHLQNVVFRSIENRAPTARASNTGISGFIDSCGRVVRTLPAGTEGTATNRLMLDQRVTFYTRHGDVFAEACAVIAAAAILIRMVLLVRGRWSRDARHGA